MRHRSLTRNGNGEFYLPERIVPPTLCGGYHVINLWRSNKYKRFPVHRIVALAFYGWSDLSVDHINGDRLDNALTNLRYCTLAENTRFQHEAGRVRFVRGEQNGKSKLSESAVRIIRSLRAEGQSYAEIAKRIGVSIGAIQAVSEGRTWSHVT